MSETPFYDAKVRHAQRRMKELKHDKNVTEAEIATLSWLIDRLEVGVIDREVEEALNRRGINLKQGERKVQPPPGPRIGPRVSLTAKELPDLRIHLLNEWRPGKSFDTAFTVALSRRIRPVPKPGNRSYQDAEMRNLETASLWWVSAQMVDLLSNTATHVPDNVFLKDLQSPNNTGLVYFEKPIIGHGVDQGPDESPLLFDAMLWGVYDLPAIEGYPPRQCIGTSFYRYINFEEGMSKLELEYATKAGLFSDADRKYPAIRTGANSFILLGTAWAPLGRSDWPINECLNVAPWQMPDQSKRSFFEDRKLLAAFWTLIWQEGIASRTIDHADRPVRRRSERAGVKAESSVQVVKLRPVRHSYPKDVDTESKKVEWTHQWIVNGHWRMQPCGKERAQRKLVFVRPYIKGPEDKPLVVKERVNAWVR